MHRWVFLPSCLPGKRRIVGWWRALLPGEVVATEAEHQNPYLHCQLPARTPVFCSKHVFVGPVTQVSALRTYPRGMHGAFEQENILCHCPSLPSHPGTWGMCSWALWGTGGVAASPLTEMFAEAHSDPGRRKCFWSPPYDGFGFNGIWAALCRWKDLEGILGGECNTSSSCQNLRPRGSLHRAELDLSSPSQPAQVGLDPIWVGLKCPYGDMGWAAEPLLLTWHMTWSISITC